MGKKAANFRAWQYQNPHGTVKDAWNAAWEGQNALQYSLTIQKKDAEIERLRALLAEARDDIREEVETRYPFRDTYPEEQRRYERDMAIVHRMRDTLGEPLLPDPTD